jgi:hypothetical protein
MVAPGTAARRESGRRTSRRPAAATGHQWWWPRYSSPSATRRWPRQSPVSPDQLAWTSPSRWPPTESPPRRTKWQRWRRLRNCGRGSTNSFGGGVAGHSRVGSAGGSLTTGQPASAALETDRVEDATAFAGTTASLGRGPLSSAAKRHRAASATQKAGPAPAPRDWPNWQG